MPVNSAKRAFVMLFTICTVLIALASPVFAIDVKPSISITADTTSATTTATLTAVAVDVLDNAGIQWIKLFENGAEIVSKDCSGLSSCTFAYAVEKTVSGTFTYYATTRDLSDTTVTSESVSIFFNQPPVLNAIGPKSVLENATLQFVVSGSDPNPNDALTFGATGVPAGATFDAGMRTFIWTPNFTQSGVYNVNFTLTDGYAWDWELVTITVNDVNQPPQIISTPVTTATEDVLYTYNVNATDPENDPLSYGLATAPTGMTIDAGTGLISWTPGNAQVGANAVNVTVSDGSSTVWQAFTVTVVNANDAPVFAGTIPGQNFAEDGSLVGAINLSQYFTDDDLIWGDTLAWSVSGNTNVLVTINNGVVDLSAVGDWSGSETLTFRATDSASAFADSNPVVVTVTPVNDAPYLFAALPDVSFVQDGWDASINMSYYFRDVDSALMWSWISNDSNVSVVFTPDNLANITATAGWTGTAELTLGASDDEYSMNDTIAVTVSAPVWSVAVSANPTSRQVTTGQAATYTITINNTGNVADNYTLTVQNPDGANQAELNSYATPLLNPAQTYTVTLTVSASSAGTYNVGVTATSPNATASVSTTTTVTTQTGGGGGGGAGGGGGYVQPPQDKATITFIGLQPSMAYAASFALSEVAVTSVTFSTIEPVDSLKLTIARIFNWTNQPLVDGYQYVDITATPANKERDVVVGFKVSNAWLADHPLKDGESISLALYHTNGTWEWLPTQVLEKDAKYTYYKAASPRFGTVAIAVQPPAVQAPAEQQPAGPGEFRLGTLEAGEPVSIDVNIPGLKVVKLVITPSGRLTDVKVFIKLVEASYAATLARPLQSAVQYFELEAFSGDVLISDDKIESVKIVFRLEKAELDVRGGADADVRLERWGDAWERLLAEKVREDDWYVTYEATSPGFSLYAIAASAVSAGLHPALVGAAMAAAIAAGSALVVLAKRRDRVGKANPDTLATAGQTEGIE